MVYSLENIRFLRQELERLTEKSRELGENLAELKRRAGLAPEDDFPAPEAGEDSRTAGSRQTFDTGLFSGRFTL